MGGGSVRNNPVNTRGKEEGAGGGSPSTRAGHAQTTHTTVRRGSHTEAAPCDAFFGYLNTETRQNQGKNKQLHLLKDL